MIVPKQKNDDQQPLQSHLKILGYFSNKLQEYPHKKRPHPQQQINNSITNLISRRKIPFQFKPVTVIAQSNCMTIIDKQKRAWLVADFMTEPICLSEMMKLKIRKIAMSYGQLIAQTKEGCVLVTWTGRKILSQEKLIRMTVNNQKYKYGHLFQFFKIQASTQKDRYYFTTVKKIADQNSLYAIIQNQTVIIGYPKIRQIKFQRKVVGVSVGKNHKLCWDEQGKLFSWGYKSIALGYELPPNEQYILQPRQVEHLPGFVIKACADINYSLAITLQGKLYEWGIKKTDPKNEELIFEPKQIIVQPNNKFIDLKGGYQKFGVLTLSGQLYIWGKNSKHYFTGHNYSIPWQWQNSIIYPMKLNHGTGYVTNFQISESYLALVVNSKNIAAYSDCQKYYWGNLKENIKQNLKLRSRIVRTEGSEERPDRRNKFGQLRNMTTISFRKFKDPIELAFSKRKSKQEYLQAASDSQRLINFIMQPTERKIHRDVCVATTPINIYQIRKSNGSQGSMNTLRCNTMFNDFSNDFKKEMEYVKDLVSGVEVVQAKQKMIRFSRNNTDKIKLFGNNKKDLSYDERLEGVKRKKEEKDQIFLQQTLKKVENRSYEFRMQKLQEHQESKRKNREREMIKHGLQKMLIKQFLVKLLTKPTSQGREAKISNFARHLKLERLEKNIRGVFIRNRVKLQMKKLKKNQMFRFFLLTMTFQQYVKHFRLKKYKKQRKFAVYQLFKSVIKQKMKVGISACIFNIRKLQKFRQWLVIVKAQRKKCLKYIWKVQLLSMMKINSDHESSAIFYLPKNIDQLSFEALYQEKVAGNAQLKLGNFLNKYSIFKIKATYFQKLVTLFSEQRKRTKSAKMMSCLTKPKKCRIKFYQDEDDKQDRLNLMQTDMLPYSLHYNLLIHPKNYDITIPQIMKQSQKWMKQQRKIFELHIQTIIRQHQIIYLHKKREYDVELANYIKKNYQVFGQKRWKYIIEYNKLEKTFEKYKKEKQLRRLMRLIGAERLLDQDCIPEKQAILDEVHRRTDAPIAPNCYIVFGINQFKKMFRSYYEHLSGRAKELRRSFF